MTPLKKLWESIEIDCKKIDRAISEKELQDKISNQVSKLNSQNKRDEKFDLSKPIVVTHGFVGCEISLK